MRALAELVDREILDAWVLATAPRAFAYAFTLLRDRAAAEDVVQDCYYRLLRKADVYDLPVDGLPLLLKSVSNACINHKTRRRTTRSLDAGEPGSTLGQAIADRSAADPQVIAMSRELEATIDKGLARLPLTQRAALELKSLGHSLEEIAEILGLTSGNVGVLIHRGRKAMAESLAPYLGDSK